FLPAANESQFVELKNAGTASAGLAGLSLSNGTVTFTLPESAGPLGPGEFGLVLFDGVGGVNGRTIHAPPAAIVDPTGDVLILRGRAGGALDSVSWGRLHFGGVRLSTGGRIPD